MASPQNHWKLGLFVVAGLALTLAVVVVIGARSMHKDVGLYVSYFDESVQGLEVGSPIKFRGVTIGNVGKIQVAPDHRHVMVESELGVDELARLGLDVTELPIKKGVPRKLEMTADLRMQLASSGLTGVKFLQLDFFDVKAFPAPELPFAVPKNCIPTAPSMMKSLEDSLTYMIKRLPEITDKTASILAEIDVIVHKVSEQKIPEKIASTLGGVDAAVGHMDVILDRIGREEGLLASIERVSVSIGDTLRDADGLGGQLLEAVASVQAAARSIRKFVDALEQDPDMLMKGRSKEKKP
ncbi:MAG: MlaD family protein [Myxococcota bacterium]|jgi:paraquat-inducible protein B